MMPEKIDEKGVENVVLADLGREFAEIKEEKSKHEAALKKIEKKIEIMKEQIIGLMTGEGMQSFKLKDIGLIYISLPARPKVVNQDAFFKWLEDNNEDYIIKPTIHHKTLGTWFKRMKEVYEKEDKDIQIELKDMLSVYEDPLLNFRRT